MGDLKENFVPLAAIAGSTEKGPSLVKRSLRAGVAIPIPKSSLKTLFFITVLFCIAGVFQTLAWYHDVEKGFTAFWLTFLISMGYVFMEYLFLLPANRIGYAGGLSVFQLGVLVEFTAWMSFLLYVKYYRKEELNWKSWLCVALIAVAVIIGYS